MAAGHQAQLREDLAPAWGLGNGDTVLATPVNLADGVPAGVIPIRVYAVTPTADAGSGAEAEHDDVDGPGIEVFYDMLAQYGIGPETPTIEDALSAAISHELIEERCDPTCDRTSVIFDGRTVAVEPCDQVQAQTYRKLGVCVSNFNFPSNFAIGSSGAPFDFLGSQSTEFQCMPGGYEQWLDPDAGWQMITADRVQTRESIDVMPSGMARYRAELAWRRLGRHAKRKRRHAKR